MLPFDSCMAGLVVKRKCGADFVYPSDGCGKTNNNDKRYDTPHLIDMGYRRTKYALPYANKK